MSDLTQGGMDFKTVLEWGVDDLEDWLDDALEWRKDVNRAMGR